MVDNKTFTSIHAIPDQSGRFSCWYLP